jgi:hypothetical protein
LYFVVVDVCERLTLLKGVLFNSKDYANLLWAL